MRNTAWSGLAAVVMSVGRLGLAAVVARRLSTTEFGDLVFSQWVVDTVFLFGSFGLTGAATRFFPHYMAVGNASYVAFAGWYRRRALWVIAWITVITPCLAYGISPRSDVNVLLIAAWACGNGSWALAIARLQGLQQFRMIAVSNAIYVIVAFVGVAFVSRELGVVGIIVVFVLAAWTSAILSMISGPSPVSRASQAAESKFSRVDVSSYALNMWMASSIGALVWSRAEISVVRAVLTSSDVAFYGAALTISGLANSSMALMTGALGPRLAQLWGQGKIADAFDLSRVVTDLLIFSSGIAVSTLILFSNEILLVAFGRQYQEAGTLLSILALGAFGLTSGCVSTLVQYETNGKFARDLNLLGAVLLFSAAIPLVDWVGVTGAAIARCAVQLVVAAGVFGYSLSRPSSAGFRLRNILFTFALLLALLLVTVSSTPGWEVRCALLAAFILALVGLIRIGPANLLAIRWFHVHLWQRFIRGIARR